MNLRGACRIAVLLFGCLEDLSAGQLAFAQDQDESEADRAKHLYLEGVLVPGTRRIGERAGRPSSEDGGTLVFTTTF